MLRAIMIFLVAILAHQGPCHAQQLVEAILAHDESGLEIWLPERWYYETEGGQLLIHSPGEEVTLRCFASELQVLNRFSPVLFSELSKVVTQPEILLEKEAEQVNELLHFHAEGVGLYKEEIVDWEVLLVAGAQKSLMIIALGDIESFRDMLAEVYSSIRPIPKPEVEEEEETEEGEEESPVGTTGLDGLAP